MDANDRALIDGVFDKVAEAEAQAGPRDADAEALIAAHLTKQPHAPYYMAQGIVMLEESLKVAQNRIEQLEYALRQPSGGGLLGSLFGGGGARGVPAPVPATQQSPILAHAAQSRPGGGGFMAGAGQTMMAVAGGLVLGNLLSAALMPDMAQAAESEAPAEEDADYGGGDDMDIGDMEW